MTAGEWLFNIGFMVIILCVATVLLSQFQVEYTIEEGYGIVTDKWEKTVKDGFGSSTEFTLELNNTHYITVNEFDYHNNNVNDTFYYKTYRHNIKEGDN